MTSTAGSGDRRGPLLAALGVDLGDEFLTLALTHRSFAYENGGLPTNERLEFLGDAVLGRRRHRAAVPGHPDLPEGQLAKLRASVVTCARSPSSPRGLRRSRRVRAARQRRGATGGAREGLDPGGHPRGAVRRRVPRTGSRRRAASCTGCSVRLLAARRRPRGGARLEDQPAGADRGRGPGRAGVRSSREGPDHAKTFTATAVVGGRRCGPATGRTKKEAEQKAAERPGGPSRPRPAPPATGRALTPGAHRCPSCPRSRSSARPGRPRAGPHDRRRRGQSHPRAVRRHAPAARLRRPPDRPTARRGLRRGKYLWLLRRRRGRRRPRRTSG